MLTLTLCTIALVVSVRCSYTTDLIIAMHRRAS